MKEGQSCLGIRLKIIESLNLKNVLAFLVKRIESLA